MKHFVSVSVVICSTNEISLHQDRDVRQIFTTDIKPKRSTSNVICALSKCSKRQLIYRIKSNIVSKMTAYRLGDWILIPCKEMYFSLVIKKLAFFFQSNA